LLPALRAVRFPAKRGASTKMIPKEKAILHE
jgi:hypothetical protein